MPVKSKPAKELKVQLFVQERNGDHNLEKEYLTRDMAWVEVENIRKNGGYWTSSDGENNIFVPWHSVDHVRVSEVE